MPAARLAEMSLLVEIAGQSRSEDSDRTLGKIVFGGLIVVDVGWSWPALILAQGELGQLLERVEPGDSRLLQNVGFRRVSLTVL